MNEVLERYEYLMVYRLMDGRGLETDDVRDLLDGYYKLRKAVEEGSGRFVNRPYGENGPPRASAPTEDDTSSAAAAAPLPVLGEGKEPEPAKTSKKARKKEPETAPDGGGNRGREADTGRRGEAQKRDAGTLRGAA